MMLRYLPKLTTSIVGKLLAQPPTKCPLTTLPTRSISSTLPTFASRKAIMKKALKSIKKKRINDFKALNQLQSVNGKNNNKPDELVQQRPQRPQRPQHPQHPQHQEHQQVSPTSLKYQQNTQHVNQILTYMNANKLTPAVQLYQNIVLDSAHQSNRALRQQIFALFRALIQHHSTREAFELIVLTYNDTGWTNNQKLRVHMYYDVLKESSHVDKDFQLSQEIFSEMERRGDASVLQPNEVTAIYSLMLRIMFMAGSPSSAQDLYTQLSARGSVRNSSEMYVAMIKGLARCGQLEKAEALFRGAVAEAEQFSGVKHRAVVERKGKTNLVKQEQVVEQDIDLLVYQQMKNCPPLQPTDTSTDDSWNEKFKKFYYGNVSGHKEPQPTQPASSSSSLFVEEESLDFENNEEDNSELLYDTMFDDLDCPDDETFDWLPEHTKYIGEMKFYNKSRGFGIVTLKNDTEIFIHSGRSFGKESKQKGYWKKKQFQNILKQLNNNGVQVEFGIVEGKRSNEARELRVVDESILPLLSDASSPDSLQTLRQEEDYSSRLHEGSLSMFSLKETYHAMIETYARFQHIDKAEWLFDEMKSYAQPDIKTYDVMIHALAVAETTNKKKRLQLQQDEKQWGRNSSDSNGRDSNGRDSNGRDSNGRDSNGSSSLPFNTNPSPLSRAKLLFDEITEFKHDKHLYATMIRVLIDHGELERAEEVYNEMNTLGYEQDSIWIMTSLIIGNSKAHRIEKSVALFEEYLNHSRVSVGGVGGAGGAGGGGATTTKQMRQVQQRQQKSLTSLYNSLLQAYMYNNMVKESLVLFETMKKANNIAIDTRTHEILLRGLTHTAMVYHKRHRQKDSRPVKYIRLACDLYYSNHRSTIQLRNSTIVTNMLLLSLCQLDSSEWSYEAALRLYSEMEYRGVVLKDSTVAGLITLMSKKNELTKAYKIYQNTIPMESRKNTNKNRIRQLDGIVRDTATTSLFSDLTSDHYEHEEQEEDKILVGTPRTLLVYNAMLESLSRYHKMDSIHDIQQEMIQLNINMDNHRTSLIVLHSLINEYEQKEQQYYNKNQHELFDQITNMVQLLLNDDDVHNHSNALRSGGNIDDGRDRPGWYQSSVLKTIDYERMLRHYIHVYSSNNRDQQHKECCYNMLVEIWKRSSEMEDLSVNLAGRVMNIMTKKI